MLEKEYAADLAAYKLTIQDKDPDEFKELVDTYAAKHPLNKYQNVVVNAKYALGHDHKGATAGLKAIAELDNAHLNQKHTQDKNKINNMLIS